MALKQKYIEAIDLYYEVDDWFVAKLKEFPRHVGIDIASQVNNSYAELPSRNGWTQTVGGVCTEVKPPIYFEVEYLNQEQDPPMFLDIQEIESDDYLDYYLEKKLLKSNGKSNKIKSNAEITRTSD
jgi:hypothetical protein